MAKSKWDERSEANLLPLSISEDFTIALKEWRCSREMRITTTMECELCGKKDLHYQFEIINPERNTALWVGSSCIKKFDIYLEDERGNVITTGKDTYLIKEFKHQHMTKALMALLDTQPEGKIGIYTKKSLDTTCAREYLSRQKLSPKQVNYLFLRLEQEGISFNKQYFSINDTTGNWDMLMTMKEPQFQRIEAALTKGQREGWLYRHKPSAE